MVQVVHKQGTTADDLFTVMPLKWLTDKPVLEEQWPFDIRKFTSIRTASLGAAKCSTY